MRPVGPPFAIRRGMRCFGDRTAFIGEKETRNYHSLIMRVDRYGRWALAQGLDTAG
jgi:hypothetical protein